MLLDTGGHACYGSGSFYIERNNGKTLIISPILFADKNIYHSHYDGREHWNTEFWKYYEGEIPDTTPVKRIVPKDTIYDIHQRPKTNTLEIKAWGTGFNMKNRIEWRP